MSAARDAYLVLYDEDQPASAAADWMHIFDSTEERLRRWVARSGCKSAGHRPDPVQRWAAERLDKAEQDFEQFVDDDFAHRSAEEMREAVSV